MFMSLFLILGFVCFSNIAANAQYCTPATSNCTQDDKITNVSFGTINNTTDCSDLGYGDYTTTIPAVDLTSGVTYPISVTVGPGGTERLAVWIDYNQNGVFDSTEFQRLGSGNGVTIDSSIAIPVNALYGLTRMRIRVRFNTQINGGQACTTFTYGETEDYVVNIVPPPPCVGAPNPGSTISSVASVCSGTDFDLSIQNDVNASGITYQWQSSLDGVTYAEISGATSNALTTNQSAATWYQLVVTCNATDVAISTPVFVGQNTPTDCYCTPPTTNCNFDDNILNVTMGALNNTTTCGTNGYTNYIDDPAVNIPSVIAGTNVPIDITVGGGGTERVAAWIDYNQDGLFSTDEFTALGSANGATINSSINIPLSALSGATRMRVRVRFNTALTGVDACLGYTYGETEDYKIEIVAPPLCTGTPNPGSTISSVASVCSQIDFNLSIQNDVNASGITYQWQSSLDGVTYADISGATLNTLTTNQTSATWYQLVVTCNSTDVAISTPVNVGLNAATDCYCVPPTTNCNLDDNILNVTIGALNNTTTCGTNGYTNYIDDPAVNTPSVYAGATVPISVTVGGGGTERVAAWIDYNQDGFFSTDEFTALGSANDATINSSINIPLTALSGATRMRVRLRFNIALTDADACLGYTYGETEDYKIEIVAPTPCSGIPDLGNTVSSNTAVCAELPFDLSVSNSQDSITGITYQWQSSNDGVIFTDIAGATSTSLSASQSDTTWYQLIATCGGTFTSTSTPVQVNMNVILDCHCLPPATNCNLDDVILNVAIAQLNNASDCSVDGYSNYATSVISDTLAQGVTYPMTVTVGPGGTEYVGVWIDYDQNGVYDASEFTALGSGNGEDVVGNVQIPSTALFGNTKMRVRIRYNVALTAADACFGYLYGETEDYKVTIVCGPPVFVSQPASQTVQCGLSAVFSVVAQGSSATYQWEQRPGPAATWTSISDGPLYSGTTTDTLRISRIADEMNGFEYRLSGTSCGVTSYSDSAVLTVNQIPAAVDPSSAAICKGASVELSISGDVPTDNTTMTYESGALGTAIPDDGTTAGVNHTITVADLPTNAIINNVKVKLNATHTWVGDLVAVLKAPNGKVINLAYALTGTGGAAGTTGLTNTVFSSDGTEAFSNGADPYSATFAPDAFDPSMAIANDPSNPSFSTVPNDPVQTGSNGYIPDASNFTDLFTVGNGSWTLALYDFWADEAAPGQTINTLDNWSLEITYSTTAVATGVWSPATGLYTDSALTTEYNDGDQTPTVYAAPSETTEYTLVSQTPGCNSAPVPVLVTIYPDPVAVISASPYTSLLPGMQTSLNSTITVSSTPTVTYQWQLEGNDISGATSASYIADINGLGNYTLEITDGNGCMGKSNNTVTIRDSISNLVFVYPNPTTGVFQIRYGNNVKDVAGVARTVNIYDNKGSRVYTRGYSVNAPFQKMEVDLTGYSKGAYLIEILDRAGKRLASERVMVY